ncbi:MAG TPA: P27 family phage terminase small subunit, partial [Rhizomicrobium sp.]|nr:P27 family phage terminase small subunit [Rhizomicrobium sp.]
CRANFRSELTAMGYENCGRRPKPAAVTLLRGNPSKIRVNHQEARPPVGEVTKPTGLSSGGAAVWDELAPLCLEMRTLTRADVRAFATLCELQATLLQAVTWKDKPGRLLKAIKLERETASLLRPYYALFGLEPLSRARLVIPKADAEPVNKWAGIMK